MVNTVKATARECGPERPGRVHRGPCNRSSHEDIGRYRQADPEPADVRFPVVHRRPPDGDHQEEGEDDLDQDAGLETHAGRQFRGSQPRFVPHLRCEDGAEEQTGHRSPNELADDVGDSGPDILFFRDHEPDRHGGVEVTSRHVAQRGNHDGKDQPVRHGDPDQAHGSVGFGVQYDGPRTDEAEAEGADRLRHAGSSGLTHFGNSSSRVFRAKKESNDCDFR